jgi:hypothetical protein
VSEWGGWEETFPSSRFYFSLFSPAKGALGAELLAQELATQNGRNLLQAGQLFSTTLPTVQEERGWGERIETVETWDDQRFTLLPLLSTGSISCSHLLSLSHPLTLPTQTVLLTPKPQATSRGLTNN